MGKHIDQFVVPLYLVKWKNYRVRHPITRPIDRVPRDLPASDRSIP